MQKEAGKKVQKTRLGELPKHGKPTAGKGSGPNADRTSPRMHLHHWSGIAVKFAMPFVIECF